MQSWGYPRGLADLNNLGQWFLSGGKLCPQGTFGNGWRHFDYHDRKGVYTIGILWAEVGQLLSFSQCTGYKPPILPITTTIK